MKVTLQTEELKQLVKDTSIADRGAVIYCRTQVRKTSLALERRIKQEMPVDTGRARASWGHWKGSVKANKYNQPDPGGDPIWREESGGLSIEQGTNVDYVVSLNNGHSQQAPAGFIDRDALIAETELLHSIGQIDLLEKQNRLAQAEMLASPIMGSDYGSE